MKTLALFDFDGTLYRKDSLIEFTKATQGNARFFQGLIWLFPQLSALKLGLLHNRKAKEKFLTHFFQNTPITAFDQAGNDFAQQKINADLNPKTFEAFQNHLAAGHTVCIVSASCAAWIKPWSDTHQAAFIGTELEVSDDKITGKLSGENCYGPEKVRRVKAMYHLEDFQTIKVYGSGKGDREMLQLRKG